MTTDKQIKPYIIEAERTVVYIKYQPECVSYAANDVWTRELGELPFVSHSIDTSEDGIAFVMVLAKGDAFTDEQLQAIREQVDEIYQYMISDEAPPDIWSGTLL